MSYSHREAVSCSRAMRDTQHRPIRHLGMERLLDRCVALACRLAARIETITSVSEEPSFRLSQQTHTDENIVKATRAALGPTSILTSLRLNSQSFE